MGREDLIPTSDDKFNNKLMTYKSILKQKTYTTIGAVKLETVKSGDYIKVDGKMCIFEEFDEQNPHQYMDLYGTSKYIIPPCGGR